MIAIEDRVLTIEDKRLGEIGKPIRLTDMHTLLWDKYWIRPYSIEEIVLDDDVIVYVYDDEIIASFNRYIVYPKVVTCTLEGDDKLTVTFSKFELWLLTSY